jgi:hypothetical protein
MENKFGMAGLRIKKAKGTEPEIWRITKRQVDSDSEVVEPKGCILDDYNGIIAWLHGYSPRGLLPIGKTPKENIYISDEYIDVYDPVWHRDAQNDPMAKMIIEKIDNDFLNACSIGFRSVSTSQEPVMPGQNGLTIEKWKLMEWSIVPIGANSQALRKELIESGVMTKSGLMPESIEDIYNEIQRLISKVSLIEAKLKAENRIDISNQIITQIREVL